VYVANLNAVPENPGTGGGESVYAEGKITGDSDKTSDAATIITGTAAGAGIGGITAGGKGAGIGAGAGALLVLGTDLFTRGPEAEMPRGSTVDAVLGRPL